MFRRLLLTTALLWPLPALAQHDGMQAMQHLTPIEMPSVKAPVEPGQSAFAAIQEIIAVLEADPATDWSKVDIEALRQHLIDMDNVTLHARTVTIPVRGGVRFIVAGIGEVAGSIRCMVLAHAKTMHGNGGWAMSAEGSPNGATLTETSSVAIDERKILAVDSSAR